MHMAEKSMLWTQECMFDIRKQTVIQEKYAWLNMILEQPSINMNSDWIYHPPKKIIALGYFLVHWNVFAFGQKTTNKNRHGFLAGQIQAESGTHIWVEPWLISPLRIGLWDPFQIA